jgi:hypothetical protein
MNFGKKEGNAWLSCPGCLPYWGKLKGRKRREFGISRPVLIRRRVGALRRSGDGDGDVEKVAGTFSSKALFDPATGRLLGAGITGKNAGELIGEAVLALEMGPVAEDIALSIHLHPTLSETFALDAQLAEGTATDTLN